MTAKHVINDFQAWSDGRVNEKQRLAIERHLEECTDCRAYFENMSLFLDQMDPASLPRLQPDPFLPARIRAISVKDKDAARDPAPASARPARRRPFGWAALTAMAVLIVMAIWVGAYVGERLSVMSLAASQSEAEALVGSFYDEFSRTGFTSSWEAILENNEEESNET
jgi:predicted anti-sigma-YlaC factor YlaD